MIFTTTNHLFGSNNSTNTSNIPFTQEITILDGSDFGMSRWFGAWLASFY